jgi:hypothetical protein
LASGKKTPNIGSFAELTIRLAPLNYAGTISSMDIVGEAALLAQSFATPPTPQAGSSMLCKARK